MNFLNRKSRPAEPRDTPEDSGPVVQRVIEITVERRWTDIRANATRVWPETHPSVPASPVDGPSLPALEASDEPSR